MNGHFPGQGHSRRVRGGTNGCRSLQAATPATERHPQNSLIFVSHLTVVLSYMVYKRGEPDKRKRKREDTVEAPTPTPSTVCYW